MKRIFRPLTLFLILTFTVITTPHTKAAVPAFIIQIIKEGVKKVIKAIDLKIQRNQNKIIWLQNAQKALENALSKLKLEEIGDWTEKQRELYDKYFQELWKVKNYIAQYQRVKDIAQKQGQLMAEYQNAWGLLRSDPSFTAIELVYMEDVYQGILLSSVQNLDHVLSVVDAFNTQMSDGQRLEIIHRTEKKVDKNLADLRGFNHRNIQLSLSRTNSEQNLQLLKQRYGIW